MTTAPSLVKADGTNTPVGALASYSVSSSSIPVDPRDMSGQIPTFNATLVDVPGDAKALAEQDVTLQDWTDSKTSGRVVAVSRNVNSGLVSVDASTFYERLNTEQTVLPVATNGYGLPVNLALEHWMLMAGVPRNRYEGNLRTVIQANWTDNYGYLANSVSKLRRDTMTQSSYDVFVPTVDQYMAPIDINAAQSPVLAVEFWSTTGLQETRWHVYIPSTQETVRYTLGRNGTSFYFKQKVGAAAETTLISRVYTPLYTSQVFVFLKMAAGSTASTVTFTMRMMEEDPNLNPVYSDTTASNVTAPLLRKRPKPFKIETGWDTSLQTLGVPSGSSPDSVVLTDVMPTSLPPISRSFFFHADSMERWPSVIPGFTGNVWDKIREFCALLEIDVAFENDCLNFTDRHYNRTSIDDTYVPVANIAKSNLTEAVNTRETARSVEVKYREMVGTYLDDYQPGNSLLWKSDTVYTLERGEKVVEKVQTDASIVYTNQPVPVAGAPVPYTNAYGAYVITGNDGYIVDPQWWKDNGGSITVKPTGIHGEIEITMQAPSVDTVRAPYRVSEGVADRPALYIFGKGLKFKDPKTVKVYTGYPDSAQDVGVTFDSPFIVNKLMAFNTGHKLANGYGSTDTTLGFNVSQAEKLLPEDSNAPRAYVNESTYWDGSHYRIEDQTVNNGSIDIGTARRFNTIAGVNGEFATGKTIADWNTLHSGKLIRDTNIAPLPRYVG